MPDQVLGITLVKKPKKICFLRIYSSKARNEIIITLFKFNCDKSNRKEVLKSVRVNDRRT